MLASGMAQTTDSTRSNYDTIRIGSMIIVKRPGSNNDTSSRKNNDDYEFKWNKKMSQKRSHTSWANFDLGFANFNDETMYQSLSGTNYVRTTRPGEPGFTSGDFNLRTGKSTNIALWIFRTDVGLTKDRKFRLTYGLTMEWNNYRFDTDLRTSFRKGSTPYVFRDSVSFSKNKLALDYFTVPLMLGFDTKPGKGGISMGIGGNIGYLYSSRIKQISEERSKQKIKGNFDVKPWRVQVVGEVGLGPVKLYGAYTPETIFERDLDMHPYSIGLRLGGN